MSALEMVQFKVSVTPEMALMARFFEADAFEAGVLAGITPETWDDPALGTLWRVMIECRKAGLPHDLSALFFALEEAGEDYQRMAVEMATEFLEFRKSTLSIGWIIGRVFGSEVGAE